jgi:type II secretory pathway component PulM
MGILILFFLTFFSVLVCCYLFFQKSLLDKYKRDAEKLQKEIATANDVNKSQNEKIHLSESFQTKLHESRMEIDKDLLYLQKDLIKKLTQKK